MVAKPRRKPQAKASQIHLAQQVKITFEQALAFHQSGQLNEAQAIYQEILKLHPRHFDSLHLSGVIAAQAGNHELSVRLIGEAITINPTVAAAHNNRGNALKDLQRPNEALADYNRALSLKPDYAEACNNRGNALIDLMRLEEAVASYDTALSLKPDYAEAHNNRANTLRALMRLDEALASYDKALALKPDYSDAYNNQGVALEQLNRLDEALESYNKALSLNPDYAEAQNNRGNALLALMRLDEALASYDKALTLKPDYAQAFYNRGNALVKLGRLDEAVVSYDRALSLKPEYEFLFGAYLHTKQKLCDWKALADNLEKLKAEILASKRVAPPFAVLGLLDSPELQKLAAFVHAEGKYPQCKALGPIHKRPADNRIRVGYYSADFHNHATAHLTAELFEAHSLDRFQIYGFSFGPDFDDEMRKRVSSAFYRFIDIRSMSDRVVAALSRELGIDIAVDLKGYTQDARTGIFAERCAPVQVNYLGYPGTMAAEYIDYIVADKIVIPDESRLDFGEKVVQLPHSYQVNDSKRKISDRVYTREELKLPVPGFVFCCFNNNYKIVPATFRTWMRILREVEGSVLWLLEDSATAADNLRKEAEARGVDGNRLVFAKRMLPHDHLARHKMADLFLDTWPYSAHTTASDALWAGLPVLTCMGRSFASRVAASLLNAIGLQELVTSTEKEYEATAIDLARDPAGLKELRNRLEANRLTTPLFDGRLFATHLEAAYQTMYERSQAGLPPDNIEVPA